MGLEKEELRFEDGSYALRSLSLRLRIEDTLCFTRRSGFA